jgi:hypothetical protein
MFGEAGRICAELVCQHVKLFDEPLNPLKIRIVLAPIEIGPYNRHYGYTNGIPKENAATAFRFILGNRHISSFDDHGAFVLHAKKDSWRVGVEDFLVHELTHHRQDILLARHGWPQSRSRGVHRDAGWYSAISEAAPRYLGVAFPESLWPKQKSVRVKGQVTKVDEPWRMTEVEATHWPDSFRPLIAAQDKRLEPVCNPAGITR